MTKEEISISSNVDRDLWLKGLPNELIQCFINIFNNSKDAMKETNPPKQTYFYKRV